MYTGQQGHNINGRAVTFTAYGHTFTAVIAGTSFGFNSMNVIKPSLSQVYFNDNGKERRYHMRSQGADFVFAMREECPKALVELEPELCYAIKQHYELEL